jgi:dihydroorotate dehydrogenase electron transfer subunit
MIWIPGVDEIPMSISLWSPSIVGITVQQIGEATKALTSLKNNDWIGIRGPFGTGFTLDTKRALVVGGGIGLAPLRPLTYSLLEAGCSVTLLIAAKTKDQLLYVDEFRRVQNEKLDLLVATDDGSDGNTGLATEIVEGHLKTEVYDTLYTCGPELMMYKLYEITKEKDMNFQASLERYMKCGCGICGTCAMDPSGILVCLDGPVLRNNQLAELDEFGQYHRDATGVREMF